VTRLADRHQHILFKFISTPLTFINDKFIRQLASFTSNSLPTNIQLSKLQPSPCNCTTSRSNQLCLTREKFFNQEIRCTKAAANTQKAQTFVSEETINQRTRMPMRSNHQHFYYISETRAALNTHDQDTST
jgi:hypothetical protein